ncbi:DsrE family protein [Arthrobacter sp. TB 23]|uniref:DsrE family protein n=1 Tax=Arthrobacter sp. TB 23 TaxID=494419 RepID=UPI00030870EA|nr:DsrE family protein [Arthrobacter sp. TB 23]
MSTSEPTPTSNATGAPGVLLHGAGQGATDGLSGVLRSAINTMTALPDGTAIEIVIQGRGVALLTAGSEMTAEVAEVLERGLRVLACENSMRSAGVELDQLLAGVGVVPAATAHLATRQWEGWAYVRL